eukprot:CAMPEP_0113629128 /NCGR_PEP_ID=MMETSP0017_2-20120614/15113_1 /TAXON_ID=2856 /ORGANISM="Cylindrotheca closterium" /LENGTH=273 /DNA_ID=CAMNT_0000539499 /DNA_START=31 /DNA_END=852 /DNA_ORIENTATION=- /assembly_acc=CAM_ASM_000147
MDLDMEATTSDNFSLPIDQSVLDRLPDFDDLDDFDDDSFCDSEAEYSYGDSDSCSSFELDDEDTDLMGSDEAYGYSSLFTIIEETEEELMSVSSYEEDDETNDDLDSDSRIQMPRRVSLHAYLEKDGRRNESNTIDMTHHQCDENIDSDLSESTHAEENCLRRSGSLDSFQDDDDAKSLGSNSTCGSSSFRVAKRRLQKEFSLKKLKQAVQAADLSSSFRKDDGKTSKCIGAIEQSLLDSPENARSTDGFETAKHNLLNAITSSKAVLTISKE